MWHHRIPQGKLGKRKGKMGEVRGSREKRGEGEREKRDGGEGRGKGKEGKERERGRRGRYALILFELSPVHCGSRGLDRLVKRITADHRKGWFKCYKENVGRHNIMGKGHMRVVRSNEYDLRGRR